MEAKCQRITGFTNYGDAIVTTLTKYTAPNEMSIWETQTSLDDIKATCAKDLTNTEFKILVQMGKATGLNPYLKEIWGVKYGNNPAQIFVGRDGYRKSAQAHVLYDYHTADAVYSNDVFKVTNGEVFHEYSFKDRGVLVGGYCVVQRKGSSKPSFVFVDIKEYNKNQSVWKDKPATMIKKVAEAQCLRMAFQELFSGTYHEDEEYTLTKAEMSDKPKGIKGVEKLLEITDESTTVEAEFDEVTGEIEEPNMAAVETIKFLIEASRNAADLKHAKSQALTLPESERAILRDLYNKREKELLNQVVEG